MVVLSVFCYVFDHVYMYRVLPQPILGSVLIVISSKGISRWYSTRFRERTPIYHMHTTFICCIFLSLWLTCSHSRLLVICNYHNRSDLMKLMISCLDFAHDVKSRVILCKILTAADSKMRLYATKHMRVLLRSKMPFFNSWGLEMLIYQVKYYIRP
jgi:hypothetical protein